MPDLREQNQNQDTRTDKRPRTTHATPPCPRPLPDVAPTRRRQSKNKPTPGMHQRPRPAVGGVRGFLYVCPICRRRDPHFHTSQRQ